MRRGWIVGAVLLAGCVFPVRNDPSSTDLYGFEVGLVRTYQSRMPVCGHAHSHLMEKRVVRDLAFPGGKAVLVEVRLSHSLALHALPTHLREVFTETEAGFGFYGLKEGESPDSADPGRIEIELPKPAIPGTRRRFQEGEIIVEAVEDVSVRAGRFLGCVRVRFQFQKDGNVFWFAPGVGMVRGFSEKKGSDDRPAMEYELIRLSRPSGV